MSDTYDHEQIDRWSKVGDAERGSFIVKLYSNVELFAPKNGKFVLGIVQAQSYAYRQKYERNYFAGKKEAYRADKERMARALIARAVRIVPGLAKHSEVLDIAATLTQLRYTGNRRGASLGWANTVHQSNPHQRSPQVTPGKNFYLSSACSVPGEGQVSVILCGYRLRRMLTKQ